MFSNPIVGGTTLIRPAVKSPNYVAGSAGWSINQDGSAEFNNVTIRGTVTLGSITGDLNVIGSGRIIVNPAGPATITLAAAAGNQITMKTGASGETNIPYISVGSQGTPGSTLQDYLSYSSGQINSQGDAYFIALSASFNGANIPQFQWWSSVTLLMVLDANVLSMRGRGVAVDQLQSLWLRGWGDGNHRIFVPSVAPQYSTVFNVDGPVISGFNNWILATGNNQHWQMAIGSNYINIFGNLCVGASSTNDGFLDFEAITTYGGASGISMRQRGRGPSDTTNRIVVYPGNAGTSGGEGMYFWSNGDMMHLGWGQNVHFPMGLPALGGNTAIIATGAWQLGYLSSSEKHKQNIATLQGPNPLWQWRPVRATWNEALVRNGAEHNARCPAGFATLIAEEIAETAPDAAAWYRDIDTGEEGPSGLDTNVIAAYVVAALHELKARMDGYEHRN